MPRCNNCNRMVSLDTDADPEVELDVDAVSGLVSARIHIENKCADCGETLRTADLDPEINLPDLEAHMEENHAHDENEPEVEIEEMSKERTDRTEGRNRGKRTFYGARIEFEVKCPCGATFSDEIADDIQASTMDEAF